MDISAKPLPRPSKYSAPFWAALTEHVVRVQQCQACHKVQHPPQPHCSTCWNDMLDWVEVAGEGSVYTYSVCHWPTNPAFKEDAPYVVAMVDLDAGVRVNTNIVGCDPAAVHVDMRVTAVFDDVADDVTLLKFRPAG